MLSEKEKKMTNTDVMPLALMKYFRWKHLAAREKRNITIF